MQFEGLTSLTMPPRFGGFGILRSAFFFLLRRSFKIEFGRRIDSSAVVDKIVTFINFVIKPKNPPLIFSSNAASRLDFGHDLKEWLGSMMSTRESGMSPKPSMICGKFEKSKTHAYYGTSCKWQELKMRRRCGIWPGQSFE
jgi:hypothetical protein